MQKARRHPEGLRPLVSVWFQVLFTPLLRVLFTFPSRYLFAIGLSVVFSLTRWCWQLQTEFLRFRLTRLSIFFQSCTGLSPSSATIPIVFHFSLYIFRAVPRSLATTCGITYCYLFLQVLRCFSSLRSLQLTLVLYLQYSGFSHSDIYGSTLVCSSP